MTAPPHIRTDHFLGTAEVLGAIDLDTVEGSDIHSPERRALDDGDLQAALEIVHLLALPKP